MISFTWALKDMQVVAEMADKAGLSLPVTGRRERTRQKKPAASRPPTRRTGPARDRRSTDEAVPLGAPMRANRIMRFDAARFPPKAGDFFFARSCQNICTGHPPRYTFDCGGVVMVTVWVHVDMGVRITASA